MNTRKKSVWVAGMMIAGLGCGVAFAGPGDGIKLGDVVVHPFLDASANYDSNVRLVQRSDSVQTGIDENAEESDTYFELRYGLNLDLESDRITASGSVFGYNTMYQDFSEQDHDGLGQTLNLGFGQRDSLEITLNESYQVMQDFSRAPAADASDVDLLGLGVDRADRLERDQFNLGLLAGRQLSEKIELDVGVNYDSIDYDNESLFDRTATTFGGDLGFILSDKSSAFLHGDYGIEDSDALADDGKQTNVRVGMRSRGTDKINYTVSLGYITYESDLADGEEDIDESGLSYDLGIDWQISPKLSLSAGAGNTFSATSFTANNAREIVSGQVGLRHRTTEALSLGASLSYRQDDYVFPITTEGQTEAEDRVSQAIAATANYAPPGKWYNLHASVSYETSDSEFEQEDYDQVRASLGASVIY